jgi:hypothetical protein
MRRPVETSINIAKSKLDIECFTALKQEGIQQDFYAAMYLVNLVAAFKIDAQQAIDKERNDSDNKHTYKANTKCEAKRSANEQIGVLKDHLIFALIEDDDDLRSSIINYISRQVKNHVIPCRNNRIVPRNPHPTAVKHHHYPKVNC